MYISSGNFLVMAGTTLVVLGLTWGGVRFPWSSWQVLVPLILGLMLLVGFIAYEAHVPEVPLVRSRLSMMVQER